jgi:hypothetical protein
MPLLKISYRSDLVSRKGDCSFSVKVDLSAIRGIMVTLNAVDSRQGNIYGLVAIIIVLFGVALYGFVLMNLYTPLVG